MEQETTEKVQNTSQQPGMCEKHFQKYKQGTLHMVKKLTLTDQIPLNPANKIDNYIQ